MDRGLICSRAPKKAVFVDDTNVGLTAGIMAGVNTVGITTGNNTLEQIQDINPARAW